MFLMLMRIAMMPVDRSKAVLCRRSSPRAARFLLPPQRACRRVRRSELRAGKMRVLRAVRYTREGVPRAHMLQAAVPHVQSVPDGLLAPVPREG